MAQEKQIKTCEEYVLNDLFKAQKEVVALKNEKEELELQLRVVESRYSDLVNLIKDALKDNSEIEEADYFYNLYIAGRYIGLVGKDTEQRSDKEKELVYLMELISLANNIVEREE